MRIALIAPPWLPVPPPNYGGTESVVDRLARGFQDRGHEVLLVTTGDATCPVPRSWVLERGEGSTSGSRSSRCWTRTSPTWARSAARRSSTSWPAPVVCSTRSVLTFREGAAPEIVDHGVTGFVVDELDQLVDGVGRFDEIDRAACRAAVEERFSRQRMVRDHLTFFEEVLDRRAR